MAKIKHSYSFELFKYEHGLNLLIPSGVFKVKNYFEDFPSTFDIAKYIVENKMKFFRGNANVDYFMDCYIINNGAIKYHIYDSELIFYISNIQQIK